MHGFGVARQVRVATITGVLALGASAPVPPAAAQATVAPVPPTEQAPPLFRTAVDLVSVAATVRDGRGRPVRDLTRDDFSIIERDRPRRIVDFRVTTDGPTSMAILMDTSGSMRGDAQLEASRQAVEQLLSQLDPSRDEVSLFTFDDQLRRDVDFTRDHGQIRRALREFDAFGQTSLYDAIAEAARRTAVRPAPRRAVVVVTDGVDTSSRLGAADVSGIASAIDVPVYVVAVLSPLDHPGTAQAVVSDAGSVSARLKDLATWTGGDLLLVSAPAHANVAARTIVDELRHQYLLAFEASAVAGWHPLEVRTPRRSKLTVRARSGYFAVTN